ncbi:signal peptide peptidase SppA [Parvularcula maris]|uniref:Signal peptide peptidase SppA n=1 Tax=Parvularcula maris TaxID=2965077 RepID=A0A9X2RI61_9PROT|nr:signal peptide peptidase SppA [Parvularcula maris]MCQ8185624.1 signal peptide peptidase SppA [Parvularcula maris]
MTEFIGGQDRPRLTVWQFFKSLGKVVVGGALLLQAFLFIVVFALLVTVLGSINQQMAGKNEEGPSLKIEEGSALLFNPKGVLAETAPEVDQFQQALNEAFGGGGPGQVSVHELIRVIEHAKGDERISAMVLDLGGLIVPDAYLSKAMILADAVEDFRESGKEVVAVGDFYGQNQYLINSEASTVLMHDQGSMIFSGFGAFRTYYASLLEKLDVTVNVFRVGTFKSALEPVLRDDMSPEAELANVERLAVMWDHFTSRVDENRGLQSGSTAAFANQQAARTLAAGGSTAEAVVAAGYVDQLMTRQGQKDFIGDIVGFDDEGEPNTVALRKYKVAVPAVEDRPEIGNIAVITVEGTIIDGAQEPGVASGSYIAQRLKEAREDEDVKAVVFRVDSPGGSAFASEIMRDEILALKEAGKPVVVSMSSLAASGGYWIAAPADVIYAQPTTITGSIGIFAYLPTFEKLANKYGVFVDGVGTTNLSALSGMPLNELPEEFKMLLQASIENGYDEFLGVVSEGRGLTTEQVSEIAEGRVWIGETAATIGLVDKLGGLQDAIAEAAALAELEDYDVGGVTKEKTKFEQFLESLTGEAQARGLIEEDKLFAARTAGFDRTTLGKAAAIIDRELKLNASFDDPNGLYVRCLDCGAP